MKRFCFFALPFICLNLFAQDEQPFKVLNGHKAPIKSLAWSPDGTRLVSGSEDKTAIIWNTATWEPVATMAGAHVRAIQAVAFTPDGKHILTAGDRTIVQWTPEGIREKVIGSAIIDIWSIGVSKDGRYVAAGTYENKVYLWDMEANTHRTLLGHRKSVLAVAFAHNDSLLVSGSLDETINLWGIPGGKVLKTWNGYDGNIYCLAFAGNRDLFASATRDNVIRLWKTDKDKSIHTYTGHKQAVMSVSLSADGKWMLTGSKDNTVILWETATGNKIYTYTGFDGGVNAVVFSPDARMFAVASGDNKLRIFETARRLFVDYYFSKEVQDEVDASPLFAPKGKDESKQEYKERQVKADEMKQQIYEKYYQKYLDLLKQQDPSVSK